MTDSIGQKLHALRVQTGLNQVEFAGKIGMTQSAISKIENGTRMPSRQAIEAWVTACGKTMEIAGIPELSEGEQVLLAAAAEVAPDDLFLLAEATRGLAMVKGGDRAMARQLLQWLADRAPAQVDGDEERSAPVAAKPATSVGK